MSDATRSAARHEEPAPAPAEVLTDPTELAEDDLAQVSGGGNFLSWDDRIPG